MRRIWLAAALALLLAVSAAASADTFYVYTENGKTLNLRSATNNSVIANIPYGTALEPDSELSTETAAYVTYKDKSGYVKWKYLVKEKPAPKKREEPEEDVDKILDEYRDKAEKEPSTVILPGRDAGPFPLRMD